MHGSRLLVLGAFLASLGGATEALALQVSEANAGTAAEYVAAVIVAGRGVVARNQDLINDPGKGDKGFTPDFVEQEIRKDFKKMTGVDVDAVQPPEVAALVAATLDAGRDCVKNNQGRINQPGKAFKGFIPAVFGRITGNILKGKHGVEIKQTTFKYRNEYNAPDNFEKEILRKFESGDLEKGKGVGSMVAGRYRYLQPIYIQEGCLKCHGDPKGELDIAGRPKEGYRVGDFRGAISVSIAVTH